MKENVSNKIENDQDKIAVGKVCLLSILVASIFSNIFTILALNIKVFNEINEAIIDASSFFNIVCISYLVVFLRPEKRNKKLAVGCIINLILINQLFSNKKLLEIELYLKGSIQKINPYIAAFCCIILVVIVLIVYGIYRRKKTAGNNNGKREGTERAQITQEEQQIIEEIDSEGKYRELEGSPRRGKKETKEVSRNKETGKVRRGGNDGETYGVIGTIFSGILLFMILMGVVGYVAYKTPFLGINDLVENLKNPGLFYFLSIVVGLVALMVLIVCLIIGAIKKIKDWSVNGVALTFRGSAILAIVIVIVLYIYADQIEQRKWTENILSILTDNGFSLLIGLFLLFLIVQIIVMMVGNLLFRPKMTDGKEEPIEYIVKEMSERTRGIELRIVKLALNLVEGGIAIFDFIPDFFTTIAALLLSKKIRLGNLDDDKKDKSSNKNKTDKESDNI